MPRTSISIKQSRPEQGDLRLSAEHASALPDFLRAQGLDVGRQATIRRDADRFALYTLTDTEAEPSLHTVRMGRGGRKRLDGADEEQFDGLLDGVAVDSAATEQEALRGEKLLEQLDDEDQRQELIVIAPHGGDIEPHTDSQAELVRSLLADVGVSCWRCKGFKPGGGAHARWHITSTDICADSFPRLATVASRDFRHAVSFHGFDTDDARPDILVGGGAPDPLKRVMRAVIFHAVAGTGLTVKIAGPGDPLGGADDDNIVNRLTADKHNGIQIEQRPRARAGTIPGSNRPRWEAIAAAVADVYRVILTLPSIDPSTPQVGEVGGLR
jgi:phage replication-related protein YjqB (UPF0714/DUF867 family)